MNILFIGDIFGEPGRRAVVQLLPRLLQEHRVDFVVANADNAAGGKGITDKIALELFQYPIDVITAGNHIWEQSSVFPQLESHPILRPYNLAESHIGKGFLVATSRGGMKVAVAHLQGTVFMDNKGKKASNPFKAMDVLLKEIPPEVKIRLIDFHAEATAEKRALAWYLDGKVSCVVGTHTHVQTSDEEVMPGGTAYLTDLGMTGPHHSVIGLDIETALKRFISGGEFKGFKVGKEGVRLEGLFVEVDSETGKAKSLRRIREVL